MQMSMKRSKSIDLTSGPILKTLSELALPIMASSLLGTAYNITDMAWIGLLGSKAVAGVGVGGMYVWLSQGLVALPRMGGQVNTAQSCGRKDYKEARSYAASAKLLNGDKDGSVEDMKRSLELNPKDEASLNGEFKNLGPKQEALPGIF